MGEFEQQYAQLLRRLLETGFFNEEGVLLLGQLLIRDGYLDPSDLAKCWANLLNNSQSERNLLVRELEQSAADFLEYLIRAIKTDQQLKSFNNRRAFKQLGINLKALRKKLDANLATLGSRWDYLHWMIQRNLYLDSRGVLQTQRFVQFRLDDVYIKWTHVSTHSDRQF